MRRTILTTLAAALFVLAVFTRPAAATEVGYNRKFGLGIMVGDPTGLSAKLWVAPTNALDFGLGFYGYAVNGPCFRDNNGNTVCDRAFGYNSGSFHGDYLWQSNIVKSQVQLDWHVGVGARLNWVGNCSGDCVAVAVRGPIGLDLMFNNPSFLEVFIELAPAFYIVPGVGLAIEPAIGVRFYF